MKRKKKEKKELNVTWQPGWEGNLGNNGYIYS